METITRKIGQNRGKPRLWLEGKCLTLAGFANGERWNLIPRTLSNSGGFDIVKHPAGGRKIAGKPERPIIDITGAALASVETCKTVSISFEPGAGLMSVRGNVEAS